MKDGITTLAQHTLLGEAFRNAEKALKELAERHSECSGEITSVPNANAIQKLRSDLSKLRNHFENILFREYPKLFPLDKIYSTENRSNLYSVPQNGRISAP